MNNYISIVPIFIFAQILLLCFILFVMKKNRPANNVFIGILLLFAASIIGGFLRANNFYFASFIYTFFHFPLITLFGPFLYFYTIDILSLKEQKRVKKRYHFIPSGVAFLCMFFVNIKSILYMKSHSLDFKTPRYVLRNMPGTGFLELIPAVIGLCLFLTLGYAVYSRWIISKNEEKIEQYFSDVERLSIKWIKHLIHIFLLMLVAGNFIFWGFVLHHQAMLFMRSFMFVVSILQFLLIFLSAYTIVNQPEIFQAIDEMNEAFGSGLTERRSPPVKAKYEKHNIDDEMQKNYLKQLLQYMENEKPYLKDSITLKELADAIAIPVHHLSIVINSQLNKNFYNFINDYRINEAIAILKQPENSDANILSIAYRSGFNSKSTFNKTFKRNIGHTPTEYRERLL